MLDSERLRHHETLAVGGARRYVDRGEQLAGGRADEYVGHHRQAGGQRLIDARHGTGPRHRRAERSCGVDEELAVLVEQQCPHAGWAVDGFRLRIERRKVAVLQVLRRAECRQRTERPLHFAVDQQRGGPHRLAQAAQRSVAFCLAHLVDGDSRSDEARHEDDRCDQQQVGADPHRPFVARLPSAQPGAGPRLLRQTLSLRSAGRRDAGLRPRARVTSSAGCRRGSAPARGRDVRAHVLGAVLIPARGLGASLVERGMHRCGPVGSGEAAVSPRPFRAARGGPTVRPLLSVTRRQSVKCLVMHVPAPWPSRGGWILPASPADREPRRHERTYRNLTNDPEP